MYTSTADCRIAPMHDGKLDLKEACYFVFLIFDSSSLVRSQSEKEQKIFGLEKTGKIKQTKQMKMSEEPTNKDN